MDEISYYLTATAFFGVIVCWFVFAGTFLLPKKPEASPDTVKAPKSFWGIALQGVGFGLVGPAPNADFLALRSERRGQHRDAGLCTYIVGKLGCSFGVSDSGTRQTMELSSTAR
ncbi:MAG: hypothetical protein ABI481_05605 [Pyrinomonadaceae bacterium]